LDTLDVHETEQPLKIGGWLILVAIGIVLSPMRSLMLMSTTYPDIFIDGTWEALTVVGSPAYSPMWAPLILGEMLINVVFFCLGLYLAYLFFTKKVTLPRWYFGLAISSSLFILIDAYVISIVIPDTAMFDPETRKEFFRSLISLFIWSPYLFFSQRAKDTFIQAK